MPALLLADGLAAIALAFAAIAAALLIRTFVVSPLRQGANASANLPLVGGALSWALWNLALIVEAGVSATLYLVDIGKSQASSWWNFLVHDTVGALFAAAIWTGTELYGYTWTLVSVANGWPSITTWMYSWTIPNVTFTLHGIDRLQRDVWQTLWPEIKGIEAQLGAIAWTLNGIAIPWLQRTGDDLAGLHRWLDGTLVPGIDARLRDLQGQLQRTEADVQARARSIDLQRANERIAALERALALLMPLALIAAASATEIANLRCLAKTPCDPLDLLLNSDLDERVTELEHAGG